MSKSSNFFGQTYEIGSDCEKPARCHEANGEARSCELA